jgi:hypothetical protein
MICHQRRQRLVPAFFGLNHGPALVAAPVEIIRRIAGGAQADLEDLVVLQAAILPRAAEGAAVGDGFAEHRVVDVGMGVDVDQGDRAVLPSDRAQDRPGQGVIAAKGQGDACRGSDFAVMGGDDVDGLS